MNIKTFVYDYFPNFLRPIVERIEASPLGYRLARGAFWSLCGAIISRGLGLVVSIVVARFLGKEGFGEFGIIQSTIGMFGIFAGFGLGITSTKFIAEYRTADPVKAGRIRALCSAFAWISSSIVALIMFLLAPYLAERVLGAPRLDNLLRIGSLFLLLTAVNGAQIGVLAGFEAFKTVAKINWLSGLVNFPLMIGGVYFSGISGAVWGMTIATGFNWLFNHVAIRKESEKAGVPYSYEECWKEKEVLWKFSLPAVISSIFFAPTEWIIFAILVNQPGGYGEMGLFNAAKQWHAFIIYIPTAISNMTLPILSNIIGEGNRSQYYKMVVINLILFTGLALLVAMPVAFFSKTIMAFYGKDFIDGRNVLLVVCFYSVLWSTNMVIGQILWSTGESGLAMVLAAIRALILLGSFLVLSPKNAFNIALAYSITYILQTLYQGILSLSSINRKFIMKHHADN